MAKKNKDCPKCPDCPNCLPGWLAAFGDLMSLLLCFFVLLLSMAVFDKPKVEEYFDVMRKSMGILDQSAESIDAAKKTGQQTESINDVEEDSTEDDEEIEDVKEEIKDELASLNSAAMSASTSSVDQAIFTDGEKEFIIEIPSSMLFQSGEYKLTNRKGKIFIRNISKIIRTMDVSFSVEVIGHTDGSDFKSSRIPRNNWDLSALRAISVITELIRNKTDPSILKLASFASNRPSSNISSQNRRVELRFFAEKEKKINLEDENFFDKLGD
jgi:chemotaxis protein MotB